MRELIVFLAIIGICLGQINLRGHSINNNFIDKSCKKPCDNNINAVLPGMMIGQREGFDGLTFSQYQFMNAISYCCDKQKTNKLIGRKFIVPDFVDVRESHLPDLESFNASLTNATKDENQTSDYKIEIVHQFQRRALNLSTDQSSIKLNLTKASEFIQNYNECTGDALLEWMALYNFIGGQLFTEQSIGAYINATVILYSNQTFTEQQLISTYKKFIQNNPFSDIEKAFPNTDLGYIGVKSIGGVDFYRAKNWRDYLSQLGPQNYVYTKSHIPGHEEDIIVKEFNSYEIFNAFPEPAQQCAKKIWNIKFPHASVSMEQS